MKNLNLGCKVIQDGLPLVRYKWGAGEQSY